MIRRNAAMAHYHPNLDDPCAHETDASQPLAQLPDGRLVEAGSRWPIWLVVLFEAGALLLLLVAAWALAGSPR